MAEGGPPSAAATTTSFYSSNNVNEQYLASLMEMGIHREDARQALRIVNNRSLEDALAVVFGESPSFSAGSVTSTGGASVEQATQAPYESNVIPADPDTTDENMMTYKMLFIVNGSLSMSSGKIAAQVAHCAIDLYQKIVERRMMAINFWNISGQRKIVVRGDSTEDLIDIERRAATNKSIVTSITQDSGRTEVARGSITCVGLFGTNDQLDPVTGHLKLLNDCLKCSAANSKQQKSVLLKQDMEVMPTPTATVNADDASNSQ